MARIATDEEIDDWYQEAVGSAATQQASRDESNAFGAQMLALDGLTSSRISMMIDRDNPNHGYRAPH